MDPSLQASFIPKKPLVEARGVRGFSGLILLIAVLFFVASIAAAGGAFAYTRLLDKSLQDKKDSLVKYQEAFDLPSIQLLVRFDTRLTQARAVLNKHIAPSAIFYFLAQQTLESVQLTEFSYELKDDGSADITLSGVADSFSGVALQSDQFGASKVLKDLLFSDIAIKDSGAVSFHVTATVDSALISYAKNLAAPQSLPPAETAAPQTPAAPAASTTPPSSGAPKAAQ
ncbi:MAG TPA: PilN domain-containing protein [Candidatus Paceibacterota bacterium]|nr:PilN domain-containing protein [Candidatus Paceibacterota bacterium]